MRILLIHQVFLSSKEGGGTRHFELGRFAVRRGHEFVAVASDVSYLDGKQLGDAGVIEHVDGVEIRRARMLKSIHRSFFWRILAFVSFMASSVVRAIGVRNADVVIGTSPPIFQAVSAWIVAFVKHRPFVLEIRDLWPDFAVEMGVLKNRLIIWLARRVERFLYRRARHIIVNSPAFKTYLIKRHNVRSEKITLISNGVDPDMFDPAERGQSIRDEFDLDGRFVVTYAGAMGPANDIPTILRAAKRLEDDDEIRFLLIGDGKDRPRAEALINELSIRNVTLAGLRPKSDMPLVLGASDVCIATLMNIPMFDMTYPNKVFDYMAAGRPMVLGIDGVIRRVMDDARAGLFAQPGNDEALSNAIRQIKDDPDEAAAMGRRGRAHVIEHFNREIQASQFVDLIERIALQDE